jgi:hypothetical protein
MGRCSAHVRVLLEEREWYVELSELGPFKNAQDFCVAQVQQVLAQIEGGFKYSQNAVDAYLDVIDLSKLYPTCQNPSLSCVSSASSGQRFKINF